MDQGPNLVVVERAPTTALAERLISLLKSEGIQAFAEPYSADETVAGEMYVEFTGIDVKVRESDRDRARQIIDAAHRAGSILGELYTKKEERESERGADG